MFKKILLGALFALVATSANAQFEAGKKYFNLSTSSLSLSYSKNDKMRLNVGALAGDRLVKIGRKIHQDEVLLGIGGRYYIEQNGIYLGLAAQFAHHEQSFDNFYLTPEIGYAFFVNQYITLEPAVYYQMSLNDFSDASTVGLKLGVGITF